MYWSVRRELWENRSITLAPLSVAAALLVGFQVSIVRQPERVRADVLAPFSVAAGLLSITAFLVGAFYCLDALHGERRDRSILFWKSLPVSDLTTVLSKASVPLVVLPFLTAPVVVLTQLVMLVISLAPLVQGGGVASYWARLPLFQSWVAMLYSLAAMALWHAPVYGWLLLVSGRVRQAAFLWAVLPPVVLSVVERVAFGTMYLSAFFTDRLTGWYTRGFVLPRPGAPALEPLAAMTPVRLLHAPALWGGLVFAAAFLAAAVRLRRYREPI